eukprot:TRINITY_DN68508_c0_g1_i1.p1 TRINITY_DN68508_c0_g1~~TRINITY_DN68508_c0_g1_i1.p1  ORF type:complete len:322 (+),score=59.39 TRINITY_DN68508_c0_g1_i1:72-1037(+)
MLHHNDEAYNAEVAERTKIQAHIEEQIEGHRRLERVKLNDFRKQHQRKEQSREWDLNDPRRVAKDIPNRTGDDDPRCGPASIQKFEGEDYLHKQRKVIQAQQQRRWCQQMVDDKDARKWAEKEADRQYAERQEEMTHKGWQLGKMVAERRALAERETADFNKALAAQKKQQKYRDQYREMCQNMEEIQNALDSDLLGEAVATTLNVNDKSRYRPDHMKGLTNDHKQDIIDTQERQREELIDRKRSAKQEDREWAIYQEQQRRAAVLLERQREREKRAGRVGLAVERKQQVDDAEYKKQLLDELYRNEVNEDFFSKFGTNRR